MTKPRQRKATIYWDSCIFFAWIKGESCWPESVTKGIEQTIESAYAGDVVIVTSTITLTEVLQSRMSPEQKEKYRTIFTHPGMQMVDVDRRIAGKAAVIREKYDTRTFGKNGVVISGSVMSLADSLHVATALQVNVREMNTLDGASSRKRRLDILTLNGNVNGARLKIVKPCFVPPLDHLKGPTQTPTADTKNGQLSLLEPPDGPQKDNTPPTLMPGNALGPPDGKGAAEVTKEGNGKAESAVMPETEVKVAENKTPADVKPAGVPESGSEI